jgi:hypothetical protein
MLKNLLLLSAALAFSNCAGIRQTNNQFTTHAEAFRIAGFVFPHDDQKVARDLVPAGGKITDIHSSAADWTSVVGVIGNIFGFHQTTVSGTK